MKKIVLVFSLLVYSISSIFAQSLDVNWTDKMVYENKKDGFFQTFIDKNSKYIYTQFDNLTLRLHKHSKKLKLVAFNVKSMEKAGEVTLVDTKDPGSAKTFKDLTYYKTIVFEHVIYVFWENVSKTSDQLYVQTFDRELKPVEKLKKIYELKSSKDDAKKAVLFVMANKKVGESIVIGGEMAASKGNAVTIEYKVLKNDLTFASSNQVGLPVSVAGKSNALTSSYHYGDDGNLHIKTSVVMDKDQRKNLKKGESSRYTIYSIVNLSSGNIQSYSMKFDNKNLFDFDFYISKDMIKIFGFFSDLTKDPLGNNTHGIFYARLDPKTMQLIGDMNFSNFTKSQLDQLFAKDKDDADARKKNEKKKKKKGDLSEALAATYNIEDVQSIDNKNLVLFCSKMDNYTTTTVDSKGNVTYHYYCAKDNVTAFKIDENGKIVWASNLDRSIVYNGWYVWDLKVVNKNEKFIVAYGSNYSINSDKKTRSTKKSKKYKSDRFEYAVFDYATGKATKNEYKVNELNTKKEDKKYVSATNISVMDNEFYIDSKVIKVKPLPIVFGCLGALVCPPVVVIPFISGNARRGTGNLGHMEVTK